MKKKITSEDKKLLGRAVDNAVEGILNGGGPFGAVIARKGKVISEAYNEVVYTNDPTAHAEIIAIRKAGEILGTHDLSNCILYASCEPCPMCLGAVYWSGIKAVYYAADRTDASGAGFADNEFYEDIARDPDERKISFIRIKEIDGSNVFRLWDSYEKKIPY